MASRRRTAGGSRASVAVADADALRQRVFIRFVSEMRAYATTVFVPLEPEDKQQIASMVLWEKTLAYTTERSATFANLVKTSIYAELLKQPRPRELYTSTRTRAHIRKSYAVVTDDEKELPYAALEEVIVDRVGCSPSTATVVAMTLKSDNLVIGIEEAWAHSGVQSHADIDGNARDSVAGFTDGLPGPLGGGPLDGGTDGTARAVMAKVRGQLCKHPCCDDCTQCSSMLKSCCAFYVFLVKNSLEEWWATDAKPENPMRTLVATSRFMGIPVHQVRSLIATALRHLHATWNEEAAC